MNDAHKPAPSVVVHHEGSHYLRAGNVPYVPVGAHYVPPSGPDWPWRVGAADFDQSFRAMAAAGMNTVRIDLIWAAIEPAPGCMDEAHLQVIDSLFDAAERHGLTLHPALFVGGEVGDAYWDLPWASGRNPHSDEELLVLQERHAGVLARRWRDRPSLVAWDLTDEPPFWLFAEDTSDDQARAWTARIVAAIRAEDPEHLITVGTASQEVDHGPFRADVIAPLLDFSCVHPYAIYSPELYPDRLLSTRMTHSAAFETALAAGAGRKVMVHEFGASSNQFDPDAIAAYDRLLCWSSFGRGAIGFYAWCWTDAEPAAYSRAPYVRMPHETQFGVTEHDGTPRPRLGALSDLARTLGEIDLDAFASNGPMTDAFVPVPHEYVHPYGEESYGLSSMPAGPYLPAERAWYPNRDVKPLVRGWLNSFVLGARAGLTIDFCREQLDARWPELPVALVPAPLTTTTNSLLHVRTTFWSEAHTYVQGGGTLYLSCSAESAVQDLEALSGVSIVDRAPVHDTVILTFVQSIGKVTAGTEIRIPAGSADLHLRGVLFKATDAIVLAVDQDGRPALTMAKRGEGHTITCAYPIELLLAATPDAHSPDDSSWLIYSVIREISGTGEPRGIDHPDVTTSLLTGPSGGLLCITNHSGTDISDVVHLPATATGARQVFPPIHHSEIDSPSAIVGAHSALIISWRTTAEEQQREGNSTS
ncbi:glycoside hydrolase 5 family protein [Glaciibacter psychrotolerans]|uniref:mannan endo-1,4-beta-mannosidase n=1 Tax=Glaciibacter psychrotolerans TaxID=670054 RepID=A0A7Z0EGJ0_9MICO|nr:cellulase family glycosylhydrolase [Leifsonia psychrotolerans]NYJ20504.1 endo-1,4-beta-mannosidase [Leifsonia psychrotolerans]